METHRRKIAGRAIALALLAVTAPVFSVPAEAQSVALTPEQRQGMEQYQRNQQQRERVELQQAQRRQQRERQEYQRAQRQVQQRVQQQMRRAGF
jgi:hypothetical protein